MALELRQLRHVLALAQHGSFGRAAAALHMTQPALSRSLKQIEWDVGKALFDRSSSGVTPTDHGLLLLRRARELVDAADALDSEVLLRRVSGAGQLTVGSGPYPAETVVPSALARFMPDNPLVGVRVLASGDWDEWLRRLRSRELDLLVAEFSTLTDEDDLEIEALDRHQVYFMGRPAHPLAGQSVVHPEETFAFPFVVCSRIPPRALHPMLAARMPGTSRQPDRPFPAIECNGLAIAKQIVEQSDAIGPFTLPSAAEELKRGRLVVLGTEPWSYAHYAIVSLKGQAPTAAAVRFRRCLRDAEAAMSRVESRLVRTLVTRPQAATAI
ncbi:MAG: LysR family transcriptional regulator [Burkholderiaceae bacterium]